MVSCIYVESELVSLNATKVESTAVQCLCWRIQQSDVSCYGPPVVGHDVEWTFDAAVGKGAGMSSVRAVPLIKMQMIRLQKKKKKKKKSPEDYFLFSV